MKEPHIVTPAHDQPPHVTPYGQPPNILFPLMTHPLQPSRDKEDHLRDILARTIARLRGKPIHE